MGGNNVLAIWVVVWVLAGLLIARTWWRKSSGGVGLIIMYLISLAMNHWLGGLVHLFPWYLSPLGDRIHVEAGFEESSYGVIAFVVGSLMVAPLLIKVFGWPRAQKVIRQPDPLLATSYMAIALSSHFILMPVLGRLPTVNALLAASWTLIVVGLCLKIWDAWGKHDQKRFLLWLTVTFTFPLLTIVTQGFLGYGVIAMVTVLTFVAGFYRPRWQVAIAAVLLVYIGLSVYVSYMRDRGEIRDVVWSGAGYMARLDQTLATFTNMEWFDVYNEDHLKRVDGRLNQNQLVGASVEYIRLSGRDFGYGETLWDALIALIPRAIWPDKPVSAGSGGLVTKYTGIRFAEGTSVGIGQVMEFYVNFGTAGVIAGFLVFGVIIALIDRLAAASLYAGDWQGFALWFLVGLAFMQTGGSLVEVSSTAGASVVLALGINRVLLSKLRGKRVVWGRKSIRPRLSSKTHPTLSPRALKE